VEIESKGERGRKILRKLPVRKFAIKNKSFERYAEKRKKKGKEENTSKHKKKGTATKKREGEKEVEKKRGSGTSLGGVPVGSQTTEKRNGR